MTGTVIGSMCIIIYALRGLKLLEAEEIIWSNPLLCWWENQFREVSSMLARYWYLVPLKLSLVLFLLYPVAASGPHWRTSHLVRLSGLVAAPTCKEGGTLQGHGDRSSYTQDPSGSHLFTWLFLCILHKMSFIINWWMNKKGDKERKERVKSKERSWRKNIFLE